MKKSPILLIVGCVLLLLAGGYFLFGSDEDEEIINRNLAALVELAEKSSDESLFVAVRQGRAILNYMAEEPWIQLGPPLPVLSGRQEVEGVILQVRQTLQRMSVQIIRNDLTVAADGQTAAMELEAEGHVTYGSETGRERRIFFIDWVKENDNWVIKTVRLGSAQ